ncbi:MAG: pallilysin-related adhesin [Treponema sp.]|nr:pallilysin-related adhesin [Treponema sp.]
MKARTIPLLFLLIILVLGVAFFVSHKLLSGPSEKQFTRAKIVSPKTSVSESEEGEKSTAGIESEKYETFVPLLSGETLLSTLTLDINNDGYDDEVIIIRRVDSQNIFIVPAILNSETGTYSRLEVISTPFTRMRAFSYMGMDVTGEHKNALIYQGVDNDGNYVMDILQCMVINGKNSMVSIGKFSCDGTVFIQQVERSESYELSLSKGESFSVWVYKSDREEGDTETSAAALNQIQQEYRWNPSAQHYTIAQEIKVTAGRLAAKELSRIQDGTVETFGAFLSGLWYKTSNTDGNIRYLFFDYDNNEIIQLVSDVQEVYEWEDSKIRHNGIYLTAVNADIMSLTRRFDIALVNVDEIKVTVRDSVNLLIKENTMWDGEYKKMSLQSRFDEGEKDSSLDTYKKELINSLGWLSADSSVSMTFDKFRYTFESSEFKDEGVYALQKIGDSHVIQLRSDSGASPLNEFYELFFGTKIVSETVKGRTIEKSVTDYGSIIFTPVVINPTECFSTEGKSYTMTLRKDNDIL